MVILNPDKVTFGTAVWERVRRITVDRVAQRVSREWGDDGPFLRFADVPEQMVTARVEMDVAGQELGLPVPGAQGVLRFYAGATALARRTRVTFTGVVVGVTHRVDARGATRVVEVLGVSATGSADPLEVVQSAEGP